MLQVVFGFDISQLAFGVRPVFPHEAAEVERVLLAPVREALKRLPLLIDIVSRDGSSYAMVRQTPSGVNFASVSVAELMRTGRCNLRLRPVGNGF